MNPLQLVLYLGPTLLAVYGMIKGRNLSLDQFRRLSQRSITLKEWNVVYLSLDLPLENQNPPPQTGHHSPAKLILASVLTFLSIVLFLLPLPFAIPYSFAQFQWDLFPVVRSLISGVLLAVSLMLAFHKKRRWMLSMPAPTGYPFQSWKEVQEKK